MTPEELRTVAELRAKLAAAETVIQFYASLDYEGDPTQEYHSMYDRRYTESAAETDGGTKARAYLEGQV